MLARLGFGLALLATVTTAGVAQATILPDNNLYLEDQFERDDANITKAQFDQIIANAKTIFGPIVKDLGGSLSIRGNWDDSTVNASATQFLGTWFVNMYGGLARRPEITPDGFVLVLCHEIGHHLGGFPFVSSWGADEGQADYFATNHCAAKVWGDDLDGNALARDAIEPTPKAACDDVWQTEGEQNLCYRTVIAGKHLADLLGALKHQTVSYDAVDTTAVDTTNDDHPAAQCRLDTYTAGALCTAPYDHSVIPGKGDSDEDGEQDAAKFSCTTYGQYTHGLRPRCWFKPRL